MTCRFPDDAKKVFAPMAQWLHHQLMGWKVLGSHLGTGSNPERIFSDPMSMFTTI